MAALQSRASAHHRHAHAQEHEDEVQSSSNAGLRTGSAAAPPAHPAAHATSGSGQTSIEDETWILFPPPRPARRPSSSSQEPQLLRPDAGAASPPDPFAADPHSDTTPSSSWHHVAHHHHHYQHTSHPSAEGVVAVAIAGRSPTTSGGGEERSDRWSTLPRPLDNASSFFEDEEDDVRQSSSRPGSGTRSRQFRQARHAAHASRSSSRPSMQSSRPNINLVSSTHAAFDGNETDLLSLPSSLSVSDRSPSEGPASPFFIDHPDTFPEPDNLDQARSRESHARSSSRNTLTAAALSRMSDIAPLNVSTQTTTAGAAEAELTSGSDDDFDELLLARAPDAMSAGIRPSRAPRRPLQSVRAPSQALSASSSGQKRRHRQAGSRDKSSKRSNTSGSVLSANAASGGLALRGAKGKGKARELITHEEKIILPQSSFSNARGGSRIARAARQIFAVDEEVVDMLNQPGSVFHQARPSSSGHFKDATSRQTHGFEAFSAQMQYELGESPYQQRIFGDDIDGNASDSGEETETERGNTHTAASVAVPRRPYHRHPALLLADSVYWRRVLRSLTF